MPRLLPPFMQEDRSLSWLYHFLARNVRWGSNPHTLMTYTLWVTLIAISSTLIVLWLGWTSGTSAGVYLVITTGALFFMVVDIAAITFGLSATSNPAVQSEILLTTTIDPKLYVQSLWQVAQTQTWRVLIVMQAIRIVLVCLAIIMSFWVVVLAVFFTLGGALVLIILALSEPIWRLQAMTAIGVLAGIQGKNPIMRWIIAQSLMLSMWVLHAVIALVLYGVIQISDETLMACVATFVLPPITILIRWGQFTLRDWCLQRATIQYARIT